MGTRTKRLQLGLIALLGGISTPRAIHGAELLKPQPQGDEAYSETFTLVVDLKDQGYLQMQTFVSNLGPGDRHGGCRFLYLKTGQKPWTESIRVSEDEWAHTSTPHPKLIVGACHLEASKGPKGGLLFQAPLESGTIRAQVQAPVVSHFPPEPRVNLKDGFYELEILVPWAKASVTLEAKGKKVERLEGFAYADHSRSTAVSKDIAKRWVRFRGLDPDAPKLLLVRFPDASDQSDGFLWGAKDKDPIALSKVKVGHRGSGEERSWLVLAKAGEAVCKVRSKTLLYRHAPAEEYGILGKMVGTFLGNPVTYTYRAELLERKGGKVIPGILEVTLVGG